MKNLYLIGFVLWFFASFFGFKIFAFLFQWIDNVPTFVKIFIVGVSALVVLLGLYKILLSLILFNDRTNKHFNLISSIYSILGLLGMVAAYFSTTLPFSLDGGSILSKSISLTFGFFMALILINGFIFFPKSLRKKSNERQ